MTTALAQMPVGSADVARYDAVVIGAGATGIQAITEIAKTAGHLTVFQRQPNFAAPLHDSPIGQQEMCDIKACYSKIFARCRAAPGGFIPRCVERNVEWVTYFMRYMKKNDLTCFYSTIKLDDEWTGEINELAKDMRYANVNSWMAGINTNVDGRDVRQALQYQGGAPAYRDACDAVAADGHRGFELA